MLHPSLASSLTRAARLAVALATLPLVALGCRDDASDVPAGPFDHTGQAMRDVTVPETPDVPNLESTVVGGVREFRLRAHVFKQQLATFPVGNLTLAPPIPRAGLAMERCARQPRAAGRAISLGERPTWRRRNTTTSIPIMTGCSTHTRCSWVSTEGRRR